MSGVTEFFKRHTRHATPVFVAGLVYVAVPALVTLDAGMESLAKLGNASVYEWTRVCIKASLVALSALGGFLHQPKEKDKETKPS